MCQQNQLNKKQEKLKIARMENSEEQPEWEKRITGKEKEKPDIP